MFNVEEKLGTKGLFISLKLRKLSCLITEKIELLVTSGKRLKVNMTLWEKYKIERRKLHKKKMLCSCYNNRVSQECIIWLRRIEVSIKTVCAPFLVTLVTFAWGSRCYHEGKKIWTSGLATSPWGRPEGKSGSERIKLSTEVPKRKVLSTTDLGALCWFGQSPCK